ncbi:MAG: DUF5721 family protein [Lachnospiraceae bacterium]|jgi:hypothetical protein|nr:DUF5721 family protein [Lachnospiraceae bacterium]
MRSFEVDNHKNFMNALLMSDEYDMFLLKEAVIKTGNTITIDGSENKEFYGNDRDLQELESPYDYAPWQKMRPIIASLIKGKHTPLSMHIVLYLNPELAHNILADSDRVTDYLILNIRYGEGKLTLTTGVAYKEFTLDKEADNLWDEYAAHKII